MIRWASDLADEVRSEICFVGRCEFRCTVYYKVRVVGLKGHGVYTFKRKFGDDVY